MPVQPFTLDQAVIAGLLFLLGIFIGMFFLAGNKWKRRYRDEVASRNELVRDNERLERENREYQSLRGAADRNPVAGVHRNDDRDRDGTPDRVDPRPSDPRI